MTGKESELINLLGSWDTLSLLKHDVSGLPGLLPELMNIAAFGQDKLSWRAAWVAEKIDEKNPGILASYIEIVTGVLDKSKHPGRKRQLLKIISLYPVAAEHRGYLTNYCLQALDDPKNPPAVKAHAMQILYNISEDEPALKEELLQILEIELELQESPGVRARARRIALLLAREIRTYQYKKAP
jgi:hypothetical protein